MQTTSEPRSNCLAAFMVEAGSRLAGTVQRERDSDPGKCFPYWRVGFASYFVLLRGHALFFSMLCFFVFAWFSFWKLAWLWTDRTCVVSGHLFYFLYVVLLETSASGNVARSPLHPPPPSRLCLSSTTVMGVTLFR